MRHTFARRAALASPLLVLTLLTSPASPAGAAEVTPVPVFTEDPYANATPPDYKLSYALDEALKRAEAKPDVYAPPYVSGGKVIAPVTTATVSAEAGEPLVLPPDLTPPDDGTAAPGPCSATSHLLPGTSGPVIALKQA